MKLQSEFTREFLKNNFRPFAAPSKCRPVRPAPPAPPSLRLCVSHAQFASHCPGYKMQIPSENLCMKDNNMLLDYRQINTTVVATNTKML